MRGMILTQLTGGDVALSALQEQHGSDERFIRAVEGLMADGLVTQTHNILHLTK
jgi:hypothetical protein